MYETRGTFFVENGIYKGKGFDLGAEPPRVNILLSTSHGSNRAPSETKTTIPTTTTLSPAKISAAILRERMRIKNLHLPDETYRH